MSLRDRPRLSDRFRGKSGDELMKEIKKEFENDTKTWFDPNGSRFRLFRREGFPFEENVFDQKSGPEIKSHLEDLAKKHPEFVGDLRCPPWGGSMDKDWERAYTIPISVEKNETADVGAEAAPSFPSHFSSSENRPHPESAESLGQQGLRHTVDIAEQIQKANASKLENESKRSSSAPPDPSAESKKESKRFATKIEITPVNPFESRNSNVSSDENSVVPPILDDDRASFGTRQDPVSTDPRPSYEELAKSAQVVMDATSARNEPSVNVVEKSQNSECHSQRTNRSQPQVRHIPIFVEGRVEPVIPKNEASSTEQKLFTTDQAPLKRKLDGSVADEVATSEISAPLKQSQASHQEGKTPVETRFTSATVSQSAAAPSILPSLSVPPPPASAPASKPDQQQRVEQVQQEVDILTTRVDQFSGTSRDDKEYLYLDEMLTRNLIKLDTIDVEGNEWLRAARKNVIKSIQKSIALLESKAPVNDNISADDSSQRTQEMQATEGNNAASVNSETLMEVDSNRTAKGDDTDRSE